MRALNDRLKFVGLGPILMSSVRVLKCSFTVNMLHQNTLELTRSALAIIDMQEAFRTTIANFTATAERIAIMVQGAKLLGLPILITEQYPKGLGHTAPEIIAVLPASQDIIEKTTFSSCGAQPFHAELERAGV